MFSGCDSSSISSCLTLKSSAANAHGELGVAASASRLARKTLRPAQNAELMFGPVLQHAPPSLRIPGAKPPRALVARAPYVEPAGNTMTTHTVTNVPAIRGDGVAEAPRAGLVPTSDPGGSAKPGETCFDGQYLAAEASEFHPSFCKRSSRPNTAKNYLHPPGTFHPGVAPTAP